MIRVHGGSVEVEAYCYKCHGIVEARVRSAQEKLGIIHLTLDCKQGHEIPDRSQVRYDQYYKALGFPLANP